MAYDTRAADIALDQFLADTPVGSADPAPYSNFLRDFMLYLQRRPPLVTEKVSETSWVVQYGPARVAVSVEKNKAGAWEFYFRKGVSKEGPGVLDTLYPDLAGQMQSPTEASPFTVFAKVLIGHVQSELRIVTTHVK